MPDHNAAPTFPKIKAARAILMVVAWLTGYLLLITPLKPSADASHNEALGICFTVAVAGLAASKRD